MEKKKENKFIKVLKLIHLPTLLCIIGFYLALCLICFILLKSKGEDYTFLDVLLFNLLTMSGGDYYFAEVSPLLIVLGILVFLFSMIGGSLITGYISSAMVERRLNPNRGLKKMQTLENHIIICGYKSDIKNLILDIFRKNKKLDSSSIVLVNNADDLKIQALKSDKDLDGVLILKGDYTEEQTLITANAKKASKVLILSEEVENLDAELVDSRVFVTAIMIHNLNPKCHICAEVKTERYKNYLEAQNCAEVIYTDAYTRYILSTSTNYNGMSKVMSSFLDNGDGFSVQIYKIEDDFIGKTYGELFNYYKKEKGFLLIGLLENMGVEKELKHQIISNAQKSTNYGEIISKLKDIKNLETNYPNLNPKDDYVIKNYTGAIVLGEEV